MEKLQFRDKNESINNNWVVENIEFKIYNIEQKCKNGESGIRLNIYLHRSDTMFQFIYTSIFHDNKITL